MIATNQHSIEKIWELLDEVQDPEVPVISIVDLGMVRDVEFNNNQATITITPTYSGCPAMEFIERGIKEKLSEAQIELKEIITVLKPAWTTDWLTVKGRKKLEDYGIAPPVKSPDKNSLFLDAKSIQCPQCKSKNTEMISQFGSTACKALYKCKDCFEPFDYFKCI